LVDYGSLNKGYETPLLRSFYLEQVKYTSYEQSSIFLRSRVGNGGLSDQHLFNRVNDYAYGIKTLQEAEIAKSKAIKIAVKKVNIYDEKSEEILFFSDGVCVGEQKKQRDKIQKKGKERSNINVMMLEIPSNLDKKEFETIVAAEGIDEDKLVKSVLSKHYKDTSALPLVCISDGATCIKNQNKAIFGENVVHILDWYHLRSKITQLMSQIAPNKNSKEKMVKFLLDHLWCGRVEIALLGLQMLVPKNKDKHQELIGYLKKNQSYIIDYQYRKEIGKKIGSGRIEKKIDIVVSKRQKRKAMAWSARGARNLALLITYHKDCA
jgi:hypothetical protein